MPNGDNGDLLGAVFDALPSPVFVVDEDVRIQEYNAAAGALLAADRKSVLKHRAGDMLHCVHSRDVPEGCGRAPFCRDCIVRDSVTQAFRGRHVVRRRTKLQLIREGSTAMIYALITASPFNFQGTPRVLLVIEDISEIAELHRMIPICGVCKKIRDDQESWMLLEAYFKDTWDLDFSHGLCPECARNERRRITEYFGVERRKGAGGS